MSAIPSMPFPLTPAALIRCTVWFGDCEIRKGNTGTWTFVLKMPEGKILARSQWGTNYEFHEKQWSELPIIWSPNARGQR